jgi:PAS domain S-box-containing protein
MKLRFPFFRSPVGAWPRSIRFQLLYGLVLLEALSLVLFGVILVHQQTKETYERAKQRLAHQATSVALQAREALVGGRPEIVGLSVRMMGQAPSVAIARVTDPSGKLLFASSGPGDDRPLVPGELAQIPLTHGDAPRVFSLGQDEWESIKPIYSQGQLYGYAWVETDKRWDQEQLTSMLRSTAIFGVIWIGASILLAFGLAYSITSPLAVLHRGTRALMQSPEGLGNFPLPVVVHNEIGDLIEAFNRMVASIDEQRSGLSDTLALLDSMLANAPIGLAFFDRRCRFVRVNRIFAEMTGTPLSRQLGRTPTEVLPPAVAQQLESTIFGVFNDDAPVRDLELTGITPGASRPWTWIANAYPIRTQSNEVRWVGLIVMDASDRKRSEEALRKTEKLAATGRLAASIAHEINNPLEAITNLLYLLSNHSNLEEPALGYVVMAEHEVRRISEITQQTLRFYRQSTLPARANLSDLLDSVLSLHQVRLNNRGIAVERKYDPTIDLHCFAGELRQVFANLVANAIDAMPEGGRLVVRARRSRNWANPRNTGVRFQVADTGSGMLPEVRKHIFEAFFTTKDVTGTGLGLWVSSEIVAKHRGTMRVRSSPWAQGKQSGTVFELFFPDQLVELADTETGSEAPGHVAPVAV